MEHPQKIERRKEKKQHKMRKSSPKNKLFFRFFRNYNKIEFSTKKWLTGLPPAKIDFHFGLCPFFPENQNMNNRFYIDYSEILIVIS